MELRVGNHGGPRRAIARGLVALSVLALGCTDQLPAPEAPERELDPALVEQAFEETSGGERGVVVLDAVDGAARVEDLGTELDGAGANEICPATPCLARLSVGEHRLVFHRDGRDDEVSLTVTRAPRAHRRVMSFDSGEHTDYIAIAVSGLTLGGLMLPILDPIGRMDDNLRASDAALIGGGIAAGALLITGIVGVVLAIADPRQTREGVSTEWQLDPPR